MAASFEIVGVTFTMFSFRDGREGHPIAEASTASYTFTVVSAVTIAGYEIT